MGRTSRRRRFGWLLLAVSAICFGYFLVLMFGPTGVPTDAEGKAAPDGASGAADIIGLIEKIVSLATAVVSLIAARVALKASQKAD